MLFPTRVQAFAPEDAKQLFEPFFTTKSTKGTGLGLWISKGIVQKYHGIIRFRSVQFIRGHITAFSVFIPKTTRLILSYRTI